MGQTVIGGARLVYNGEFDVPLAAAMSHVNRAEFYEIAGDPVRAVEESEIAFNLGSDDIRTHNALAEAFAAANKSRKQSNSSNSPAYFYYNF